MSRPADLCTRMASLRGLVGSLRRELPKPGPHQTPEQARAAYWLEQAQRNLARAEQAWDLEAPVDG